MAELDEQLDAALASESKDRSLAFVAGLLVGLGPVVTTMRDWKDFTAGPAFFGLAMSVVGGLIGTLFVSKRRNSEITALFREQRAALRESKE